MKTIEEVIKDAIRQGMQESSDEHLGNANIHRADLDGLIAQAQSLLSQGDPVALTKMIDEIVNKFLR